MRIFFEHGILKALHKHGRLIDPLKPSHFFQPLILWPTAPNKTRVSWRCMTYGSLLSLDYNCFSMSHFLHQVFYTWITNSHWINICSPAGKPHSHIQIQFPDISSTELVRAVSKGCKHILLTANCYHGKCFIVLFSFIASSFLQKRRYLCFERKQR